MGRAIRTACFVVAALALGMLRAAPAGACDPQTGAGCDMGGGGTTATQPPPPPANNSTTTSNGMTCNSNGSTTVCSSTGTPAQQPSDSGSSGNNSGPTTPAGGFAPTANLNGNPPPAGGGTALDAQPVSADTPTGSNTGSDAAAGAAAAGGILLAATGTKKDRAPGTPPDTTQFRWRITSSTSYAIANVINVEIQPLNDDGSGGQSTHLQYVGLGPSIGAGVSNLSDWERLETPQPMHFDNSLDGPKFHAAGIQLSLPSIGLGGRGPSWLNGSMGSCMGIYGMGKHYTNPDGNSIGANVIGINVGYWHTIGSP